VIDIPMTFGVLYELLKQQAFDMKRPRKRYMMKAQCLGSFIKRGQEIVLPSDTQYGFLRSTPVSPSRGCCSPDNPGKDADP
jgi:hypothetical protein